MTRATTAKFHEMILEVESATPGTWTRLCGLTSRSISRTSNMETSEVPDCDDESLPSSIERSVQSQEVVIAAAGVWAAQSHKVMMDWWYSGAPKNIRINHVKSLVGDTQYETGPAYLTELNNEAEKGPKVTADLSIEFDGVPTRTVRAA
jgi:predicted secreted protein